ncbi:hypothetical protein BDR03DRAFT_1010460 [Suillus americanus]|nr:hypothetical protein BDR03DRAFT_1010460 [Suillus americanus]
MPQNSAHNHPALVLEEDLDSSFNEEDLHVHNPSTILDALDQMEVDNNPKADDTESEDLDFPTRASKCKTKSAPKSAAIQYVWKAQKFTFM